VARQRTDRLCERRGQGRIGRKVQHDRSIFAGWLRTADDPRGNIVLDSQQDAKLVFIRQPLAADQQVGVISITSGGAMTTLDDTAYAPLGRSFALFTDIDLNTVYRLDSPTFGFEPGTAYSTSDTAGIVGVLDPDNGNLKPIATGFSSTRGMIFVKTGD
jgi:hypothetical protein